MKEGDKPIRRLMPDAPDAAAGETADWHEVNTQEDIELLLSVYGGFHDSCIAALNYHSGAFADERRAMHFGTPEERRLSVIFQSQWEPRTVELLFSGLRQMHLAGWQENASCEIFEANLTFCEGLLPGEPRRVIVWSDTKDPDVPTDGRGIREPAGTWIVANALRWRIADR